MTALDPRKGWHNYRQTFGNGVAGQKLDTITRHLLTDARLGECGEPMDKFPISRSYQVATRLEHAPICETCISIAKEATE